MPIDTSLDFVPINIAIITISDTRTIKDDTSGDILEGRINESGHKMIERTIIPDDVDKIKETLENMSSQKEIDCIITTGGTGLTGRDGTPEAVAPLLDKTIDGFGELFRVLSFETIGTSTLQSRCLAGVANGTIVFVLPGSLDAVTTAWDRLIAAQLNPDTRPCNLVQLLPRLREPS